MKKLKRLFLLGLVFAMALSGCGSSESTDQVSGDSQTSDAGGQDSSGEEVVYQMVVLPNDGGELGTRQEAIIEEVNLVLEPFNARVEATVVDDYSVVSEAMISGQAHFATQSGATYVTSRIFNLDIQPLVTYGPDGDLEKAGYPAYLGVNSAHASDFDGLTEEKDILDQFKGKSFAFVSSTSTSGRVVPSTTFWDTYGPKGTGEVEEKTDIFESTMDDGGIFSEVQFAGSHPGVVELLSNDRIYGGAFCCAYGDEAVEDGSVTVVFEQQVPQGPIWYNSAEMDPEHVQAIKDHLLQLTPENATAEGLFASSENPPEDEDYFLDYNDRFIDVDESYYDFIENMLADEQDIE